MFRFGPTLKRGNGILTKTVLSTPYVAKNLESSVELFNFPAGLYQVQLFLASGFDIDSPIYSIDLTANA
jgi:hypothetical protein